MPQLVNRRNGGGYDIFCGLPLYFELRRHKHRVHLANFSYSPIVKLQGGIRLTETLVGVTAKVESLSPYFPELYLARWFKETQREEVTVWCFERTGVRPLLANYRHLTKHLSLDGILLIDGGVDSLIRGDETQTGSVAGDAVSLAVVNELQALAIRLIGCVGLGAERQITYLSRAGSLRQLSPDRENSTTPFMDLTVDGAVLVLQPADRCSVQSTADPFEPDR